MENKFSELGVSEEIVKGILELGFETPTDVQREAIPKILEKKDLIVMSKTGSGKTAAFGLPILQQMDRDSREPNALILAPTRELAVQVEKDIRAMAKYSEVRTTSVYGQHNMNTEIKALSSGVDLVCGTPGRVYDHIKRKQLKTGSIRFLVLDEADRMLDMGFYDQVVQIIKALPRNRVTLLFSATMPPEIKRICQSYMNDPVTVELETETKTVDTIKQIYYRVEQNQKRSELVRMLQYHQPDSCMIFCNTRDEVDRVQRHLQNSGFWAEALHGANNQNSRMRTIEKFREGKVQILVATDVAARGIHIEDLSMVINYDIPEDRNSYVHRIGRTGRAGNSGLAISVVTSDSLMTLYEIEEHVGVLIDETDMPTDEAIAAVLAEADNKWVQMDPPPKAISKPKQHNPRHQKGKRSADYQHGKNNRSNQKDNKRESGRPTKAASKQHAQKPHEDRQVKPAVKHSAASSQPKAVDTKKPAAKPVPKLRTEKKMTKGLGEIEFIVREDTKPKGLLGKIKAFFGGK